MLTKLGLVAVVVVAALVAVGVVSRPPAVNATPTSAMLISTNACVALGAVAAGDAATQVFFACTQPLGASSSVFNADGTKALNIDLLAASLSQRDGVDQTFGDPECDVDPAVDDIQELVCSLDLHSDGAFDSKYQLTPAMFAGLALGGNQFHDQDGQMIVLGFVQGDATDAATTATVGFWDGNPPATPFPQTMVCVDNETLDQDSATAGTQPDADCDGNGTRGDGAFVGFLRGRHIINPAITETRGPTTVNVTQGGLAYPLPMVVVGEPFSLELQTFETSVQANNLTADDCPLGGSTAAFTEALGRPDKTIMLAHVVDSDGTQITGAFLTIESSNPDALFVASGISATLDVGAFGKAGPDIFCGGSKAGKATITVKILPGGAAIPGVGINPEGGGRDAIATAEYTVTGPPASMTLTATPASIDCDGINAAEVAATVLDAGGNNVENGTPVHFSVQTLGTANPVDGKTDTGVAKSSIVPVASGSARGVPVVVTAGTVTQSILVSCTGVVAAAATEQAGGGTAGGGASGGNTGSITPPNTGTGGLLPGARSHDTAFPALELAMLAISAGAVYGMRRVLAGRRTRD